MFRRILSWLRKSPRSDRTDTDAVAAIVGTQRVRWLDKDCVEDALLAAISISDGVLSESDLPRSEIDEGPELFLTEQVVSLLNRALARNRSIGLLQFVGDGLRLGLAYAEGDQAVALAESGLLFPNHGPNAPSQGIAPKVGIELDGILIPACATIDYWEESTTVCEAVLPSAYRVRGLELPSDSTLGFDEEGRLDYVFLGADMEFLGAAIREGSMLHFNSGAWRWGAIELVRAQAIEGIPCCADEQVVFEDGRICEATLSRDTKLGGVAFSAGTRVELVDNFWTAQQA